MNIRFSPLVSTVAISIFSMTMTHASAQDIQPAEGQAVVYATSNCAGEPFLIAQRGMIYNDLRLRDMKTIPRLAWEKNALCVHVGPNTTVQLFGKHDFDGTVVNLKRTPDNPEGRFTFPARLQEAVSSLKVQ